MTKQSLSDTLAEKLPDAALRQIVEQGQGDPVAVIIELNLPPQRIGLEKDTRNQGPHSYAIRQVVTETPGEQRENARKIRRTREFLKTLLGKDPHWLNAARAFVVEATPDQLREMVSFPLTKTIRSNRHPGKP